MAVMSVLARIVILSYQGLTVEKGHRKVAFSFGENMSHGSCKKCGVSFDGEDIYDFFLLKYTNENGYQYPTTVEKIREGAKRYPEQYLPLPDNLDTMTQNELDAWNSARSYGWTFEKPKTFGRHIMGIEISGYYDGVALWKCTKCGYVWKRFDWVEDKYVKEYSDGNLESE